MLEMLILLAPMFAHRVLVDQQDTGKHRQTIVGIGGLVGKQLILNMDTSCSVEPPLPQLFVLCLSNVDANGT